MSFDILGLYNGSMLMKDRENENLWSCYNGVALYGPLKGTVLKRIPAFLCQLGEWLEEHPDSEILRWNRNPKHRDPRHGHGCWFYFGGRGQHPHALDTMLDGELDSRLPESEIVLGVCHDSGECAYALSEVHRRGCLIQDTLSDRPVVVFGRGQGSSWMGAYSRQLDGQTLQFTSMGGGRFRDSGGTIWNVEGRALEGSCAGRRLEPLDFVSVKWNAWAGFFPTTEVAEGTEAASPLTAPQGLEPLVTALEAAGCQVSTNGWLLTGSLPPAALCGAAVTVAGDSFRAYQFGSASAAQDHSDSRLLLPRDRFISFFPGENPSDLARRSVRGGRYVLESYPDRQYSDAACLERLPEEDICYSSLLGDPHLLGALKSLDEGGGAKGGFASLWAALGQAGYAVKGTKPMVRQWLRPGAVDGYWVELAGDRFLVYQFADTSDAAACQAEQPHSVRAGQFVLRSDPPDQYHVHSEQTYNRPDDDVSWSRLLDDPSFLQALQGMS